VSEGNDMSDISVTDDSDQEYSSDDDKQWCVSPESYTAFVHRQEKLKSLFTKQSTHRIKKPSALSQGLRSKPQIKHTHTINTNPSEFMSKSLYENVVWEKQHVPYLIDKPSRSHPNQHPHVDYYFEDYW
jgi:hypothetical protein